MTKHLAPSPYPIGIIPNFIATKPETLVMVEKVLTIADDTFTVKTIDDRALFKIQGKKLSPVHHRKEVLDMQGTHLFTINKKVMHIPASYYAEDPAGKTIFEIKGKLSLIGSKAEGGFINAAPGERHGQPEELAMHGSIWNHDTVIRNSNTGTEVAHIDRKLVNARQILADRQSYAVTVAPGVDMALIAAMCVCLDERRDEK